VLVADSASITHFVLERMLGREGFEVYYVKYPRDLVAQIRNLQPDFLFLEPEISGGMGKKIVEFLAGKVDISLPIILITRLGSDHTNMRFWPGVRGIIHKPLNSDKVLEAVNGLKPRLTSESAAQVESRVG
jgi:DNA-binding response OmpR family regulator